ncbi:PREDICTED: titin-like [Rhagoletis zephyria]|uniref:titin-like n=1 Tax=Rhagoletis zephyria TaxID=28612 RepID=UPI0008115EB4|nr:PREDICTED: titin-like [Rhagoletis zephyria]
MDANEFRIRDPRGFPHEGVQTEKPPPKLSFSENSSSLVRCVPNERATFFVKIDCDEDSDLLPLKFEWSRGELPIENSDRFRITQTSTAVQLAVEHVQREDAGHYTLIARTKGNNVIRKDVELIVEDRSTGEDPPIFLRRLTDLSVKVGTRTRLLVEIRSSTELKLTWYRNDRRICETDRIKEINEGTFHYLEVSPVILEDGGQWMVLAENTGGRNSCIAHLNVLVPKAYKTPEFIEELRAILTQQGTVSLECKVVGVPTPQLRWFKDSKEIKAGDVFALTANVDDPTSLGTYTCEAVNCMGKSYSSSKVHVMGRGSREGSLKPADSIPNNAPPPIFTNELRDLSVRIGEPIILGCQVVVPPWPKTVVWYNKNGRIESSERYKLIEDGLGVYMIEVKPSESCDEGEWKCVVTSYEGCVGISTCNVTMDIPKNYRKPRFMESLRAVLTEEGLVSFECKVVGFPTPVLKWFKDGQELKPGDVYQLTGTNSLGTYCCIAKNCMGESSSVAVLTVEDIKNQLNDEERLTFANQNQPPKFVVGLKSQEAKINEFFQFTVNVNATPDPMLSWFRDEFPIENSERYSHYRGEQDNWHLDIRAVEFVDQAEWKCVAVNDFGTSVTSSYLKLQIPRHYKKPRFLECLRAVLTEEGAVNLECKVIGVPQPVLKWYKDGVELKPGDIHRIISGQDGTCCLGTYTCEARNCMGVVASSASLLGFEEAYKNQKHEQAQENELQRNFSLSTIQEERTSQLYETPVGDITIDSKGEVSFSFDGKEVSVSLYETPDLTEEEALKIVEMYADQISEHVTEHNVVELPPLRFVKETSQSGKLLMEAVVIDISPEYFSHEEDMRTEAGLDDISINEITVHGSSGHEGDTDREAENYAQRSFEKMEEDLSLTAPIRKRKKSRPTETTEEFYSLSKASDSQAGDEEDTSDLQTFASATQMSSRIDSAAGPDAAQPADGMQPPKRKKAKGKTTDSDSSKTTEDDTKMQDISGAVGDGLMSVKPVKVISSATEIEQNLRTLLPLAKSLKTIEHHLTIVENEVVEQAAMMMTSGSAEQSIAIIRNIIDPVKQVECKLRAYSGETPLDALFQTMEEDIRKLHTSLQVIEKCVEIDETGVTLIQRTSVCIIDSVGDQLIKALQEVQSIAKTFESTSLRAHIDLTADDIRQGLEITQGTIKSQALLQEAQELEAAKHLSETVAKLQARPEGEPASFANISDAKLPDEADALKLICQPVVNIQAALEKVENELSLEENEEQIYKKVHKKVLENIVEPIKELQSVLEIIERKAEALAGTESTEQKVNMAILDIVTPALFELNKGMEIILNESSDNVQAGMLTVSTVESMVPPLQEIQNGLAQLTQDVESGHFTEEAVLDSADTQKLLQSIAQSVLHFETNIERISARLSPNVQSGLFNIKEEMSALIGNVLNENITKYHVTLLENLKRPIDELNYCIRQIEGKSISGSLTDFIDPLHSLSDRVHLGQEIMHMSGAKQNEKNLEVLDRMEQLIRRVEIDIEEHEFKVLQREVELDEKRANEEEKSFLYMRQAMEMKIAQDEAGQNIQELLHTVTEIEATPDLDAQTQKVLSVLDQSLTGLVADVEKLKESPSTREENEAATKVLTDIAKPLQAAAEVLRRALTPAKELKVEQLPQRVCLQAVLQELNEVVENIPEQNEQNVKLKALPIVQSVLKIVPALQTITDLPQASTAVTHAEKKKAAADVDSGAAKRPKMAAEVSDEVETARTPDAPTTVKVEENVETPLAAEAQHTAEPQQEASSTDASRPAAKAADDASTLEDISAMKSAAESLPADSLASGAEDKTDHLKAFEANKNKVNALLSQLKNSIATVLAHCDEVDVGSLQVETAQQVKASLSKLAGVTECIADVHQPIVVETLGSLSDASECRTFAEAVCHLEACVVQVEECMAQADLKELSGGGSISELKTLALPLQDLKECITVFHNEELEQVMSLATASLPLTSAQVLQDIQPFVLSIKESQAIETLQSLAADESLAQLKQFIKPIQELQTAVLSAAEQVHLSQIESLPQQASIAVLEKCAKPIQDIREALLQVQEETPLSTLEATPALQVLKEKSEVVYNLLQYCEKVDLHILENLADMSTQADVSALKSCAELKSLETQLEPAVSAKQATVKYLDVKECIADGIKQIQVCLTSAEKTVVPELNDVGEVMKELKRELEYMQSELSKPAAQQNAAKANRSVAKTMFKLKECLVHTYEAGVEKSLDEIEKTFEDILTALPTLEIQLAQEMYAKIEASLHAFNTTCAQPETPELEKLIEPIGDILSSTKAINELKSIDVEKSSLVVAQLQSHLMAAFRALNEVSESLSGAGREAVLKAQDAVLATNEFIAEASEQIRTIELLQEVDSLTPSLAAIPGSFTSASEQERKQALLETLMQRVTQGKAFLQSIEDGLNANNPVFYRLAEQNELDISSVEAALIRIEKEIIPKLETQVPAADDSALVDVLGVHLKSLQDSLAKLNTAAIVVEKVRVDVETRSIEQQEPEPGLVAQKSVTSTTPQQTSAKKESSQLRETSLPAEEDISTLEEISAIESYLGSPPPISRAEEAPPTPPADKGKVDVLLSQLKSSIVSVLAHGHEVDVASLQLETAQQIKASLTKLQHVNECFADVRQPTVIEPPLLSLSDASECKTFADAVCNLDAFVVQVEECLAQSDLSVQAISELKTLAQPLHEVKECVRVFHNEELEHVLSLPTISMQLTSAQVLQDIQPFVLSIKENHALETLQSLAENASLAQLKQFIQPIQELESAILSNVEQVHLSQAENISRQESTAILEKCAKPIWDIREALLQVQEETPLSTLEDCPALKVVKEQTDVIYHLLQYCEQVDMNALENIVEMSTQADVSALKSCVELKSVHTQLEPPATGVVESVKLQDVRESITNGINQLQTCLEKSTANNVPELCEVEVAMQELQHELQSMQDELTKPAAEQQAAESQTRVAKVMFKLKECIVHTYEAGVEESLDDIERTFADILQAMPTLELQLAQEMCGKLESAASEFVTSCTQSDDLADFRKLTQPLELVLASTKAIGELKLVEVQKSSLAVANLQSHLMAVFRALDEIGESAAANERKNISQLQNAVLSISEFIDTSENTLRAIELIQELDTLMTQLSFVANEVRLAKANESKRTYLEAINSGVASAKAFLLSIDEGLKINNSVFVKLAAENEVDIESVQAALIRLENEILEKARTESSTTEEEEAVVDALRVHLKNLQDKLLALNNAAAKEKPKVAEPEVVEAKINQKSAAVSEVDDGAKESEAVTEIREQPADKKESLEQAEPGKVTEIEVVQPIVKKEAGPIEAEAIAPQAATHEQATPEEKLEVTADETKPQAAISAKDKDTQEAPEAVVEPKEPQAPTLPTEPYLQKAEELINNTLALTQALSNQKLSKATTEVYKSVELTLKEIKNLLQTQPSNTIEDHIFLPLFKLKDLIAFIKRTPMDDVSKAEEAQQVIQHTNGVLLQILNGHRGLRNAMIFDITEATLPYIGSITSFITQVFPNDRNLCAISRALQRISTEMNALKKENTSNMDRGSRAYQNLQSALYELKNSLDTLCAEQKIEILLLQKESLERICKAMDEGQLRDVIELIQEFEVQKDFFVQMLEALKIMSQQQAAAARQEDSKAEKPEQAAADEALKQHIENVLNVIAGDERLKDIGSELSESLNDDERFAKLVFKLREHIVHTYDGGPRAADENAEKLEDIIENLLASNPEAARKLTEEYYEYIKNNVKQIPERIKAIENAELRKKVSALNPRLKALSAVAKAVKELKTVKKLADTQENLKKELLNTVEFLDDLAKSLAADLQANIEKLKKLALREYDYVNNSEKAAQAPKILLDTYFLTSGFNDLCAKLQRAELVTAEAKESEVVVLETKDAQLNVEVKPKVEVVEEKEQLQQDAVTGRDVTVEPQVTTAATEIAEVPTFDEKEVSMEVEDVQRAIAIEEPKTKTVDESKSEEKLVAEADKAPAATEEPLNPNLLKHFTDIVEVTAKIRNEVGATKNSILRAKLLQFDAPLATIGTISETVKLSNNIDKSSEKIATLQKVLMNLFVTLDDLQQQSTGELTKHIEDVKKLALSGFESVEKSATSADSEKILLSICDLTKGVLEVCKELQKIEEEPLETTETTDTQTIFEEQVQETKTEQSAAVKEVNEQVLAETRSQVEDEGKKEDQPAEKVADEIVEEQAGKAQQETPTTGDNEAKDKEKAAPESQNIEEEVLVETKPQIGEQKKTEELPEEKIKEQKAEAQVLSTDETKADVKEEKPKTEEPATSEQKQEELQPQIEEQIPRPQIEEQIVENIVAKEATTESPKQADKPAEVTIEEQLTPETLKSEEIPSQEPASVAEEQKREEKEAQREVAAFTDKQALEEATRVVEKEKTNQEQVVAKLSEEKAESESEEQKAQNEQQEENKILSQVEAEEQAILETKTEKVEPQVEAKKLEEAVEKEKTVEQVSPQSKAIDTLITKPEAQIATKEETKEQPEEQVTPETQPVTEIQESKEVKPEVEKAEKQIEKPKNPLEIPEEHVAQEAKASPTVEVATSREDKPETTAIKDSSEEPIPLGEKRIKAVTEETKTEVKEEAKKVQEQLLEDILEPQEANDENRKPEIEDHVASVALIADVEKSGLQLSEENKGAEETEQVKPAVTEKVGIVAEQLKPELKKEKLEGEIDTEKQKAEERDELRKAKEELTPKENPHEQKVEKSTTDKKEITDLQPSQELSTKLEQYFASISQTAVKATAKIPEIKPQIIHEKLVALPPLLEKIVQVSENVKNLQRVEKSAQRMVTLQKALMDTFVIFDDLHEIATTEVKTQLEKVKELALHLYDNIEKSEKYVESEGVLLDLVQLTGSVLEVCSILQKEVSHEKVIEAKPIEKKLGEEEKPTEQKVEEKQEPEEKVIEKTPEEKQITEKDTLAKVPEEKVVAQKHEESKVPTQEAVEKLVETTESDKLIATPTEQKKSQDTEKDKVLEDTKLKEKAGKQKSVEEKLSEKSTEKKPVEQKVEEKPIKQTDEEVKKIDAKVPETEKTNETPIELRESEMSKETTANQKSAEDKPHEKMLEEETVEKKSEEKSNEQEEKVKGKPKEKLQETLTEQKQPNEIEIEEIEQEKPKEKAAKQKSVEDKVPEKVPVEKPVEKTTAEKESEAESKAQQIEEKKKLKDKVTEEKPEEMQAVGQDTLDAKKLEAEKINEIVFEPKEEKVIEPKSVEVKPQEELGEKPVEKKVQEKSTEKKDEAKENLKEKVDEAAVEEKRQVGLEAQKSELDKETEIEQKKLEDEGHKEKPVEKIVQEKTAEEKDEEKKKKEKLPEPKAKEVSVDETKKESEQKKAQEEKSKKEEKTGDQKIGVAKPTEQDAAKTKPVEVEKIEDANVKDDEKNPKLEEFYKNITETQNILQKEIEAAKDILLSQKLTALQPQIEKLVLITQTIKNNDCVEKASKDIVRLQRVLMDIFITFDDLHDAKFHILKSKIEEIKTSALAEYDYIEKGKRQINSEELLERMSILLKKVLDTCVELRKVSENVPVESAEPDSDKDNTAKAATAEKVETVEKKAKVEPAEEPLNQSLPLYYNQIVESVSKTSVKLSEMDDNGFRVKLMPLHSTLQGVLSSAEHLKGVNKIEKSKEKVVTLQKSLMDIYVLYDDLQAINVQELKGDLEQVKTLALKHYDLIDKSVREVNSQEILEELVKLCLEIHRVSEMICQHVKTSKDEETLKKAKESAEAADTEKKLDRKKEKVKEEKKADDSAEKSDKKKAEEKVIEEAKKVEEKPKSKDKKNTTEKEIRKEETLKEAVDAKKQSDLTEKTTEAPEKAEQQTAIDIIQKKVEEENKLEKVGDEPATKVDKEEEKPKKVERKKSPREVRTEKKEELTRIEKEAIDAIVPTMQESTDKPRLTEEKVKVESQKISAEEDEKKKKVEEESVETTPKKEAEEAKIREAAAKVEEPKKDERKKSTEEVKAADNKQPGEVSEPEVTETLPKKSAEKPAEKLTEELDEADEKPKKIARKKSEEEIKKIQEKPTSPKQVAEKKDLEKLEEVEKPKKDIELPEEKPKIDIKEKSVEAEKKADEKKPEESKSLENKLEPSATEESEKAVDKPKDVKVEKGAEEDKTVEQEKSEKLEVFEKKAEIVEKPEDKLEKLDEKPAEEADKAQEKPIKEKGKMSAEEVKKGEEEKTATLEAVKKKPETVEKSEEKLAKKPGEEADKTLEKHKKEKRKKSAEEVKKVEEEKPAIVEASEKKTETVEKSEDKLAEKPGEEADKTLEKHKKEKRKKSADEVKKVEEEKPAIVEAVEKKTETVEKSEDKLAEKPGEEADKTLEKHKKEKRKKSAGEVKKVEEEKPAIVEAVEKKPETVEKSEEKLAEKPVEEADKTVEEHKKEKRKKSADEVKKVEEEKPANLEAVEKKPQTVEKPEEKLAEKPVEEADKTVEEHKKEKRKKSADEVKKVEEEKPANLEAVEKKPQTVEKPEEPLSDESSKTLEKPNEEKKEKSAEEVKKVEEEKPAFVEAVEKKPETVEKSEEKLAEKPVEEADKTLEKHKKEKRKKTQEIVEKKAEAIETRDKKSAEKPIIEAEKTVENRKEDKGKKNEEEEKKIEPIKKPAEKPVEEVEKLEEKPKKEKKKKSVEEEKAADKKKPEAVENKPEAAENLDKKPEDKPADKPPKETEKVEEKPQKRKKSAEKDKEVIEKQVEPTPKVTEEIKTEADKTKKEKRKKSIAEDKQPIDITKEATTKKTEDMSITQKDVTEVVEPKSAQQIITKPAEAAKEKALDVVDAVPLEKSMSRAEKPSEVEYKDKREARNARRAPNVELKLTNRNSALGSNIKLTCSISGAELKVDWYRDKTLIANDDKYRKTFNDGLSCLEIRTANAGDAGVYRCVAANRNGEVETSCLVTVYDVPTTKFGTTPIFTRNIRVFEPTAFLVAWYLDFTVPTKEVKLLNSHND